MPKITHQDIVKRVTKVATWMAANLRKAHKFDGLYRMLVGDTGIPLAIVKHDGGARENT